jgi:hypothetical protein
MHPEHGPSRTGVAGTLAIADGFALDGERVFD